MSSQGSPDSAKSSKKRKSPFDSPTAPGLTNKRRRSLLSLNREYVEQYSQRSNDSFMKYEDEDTRSLTSVSVASISSEQVLLNYTQSTQRDYKSIASKFGINEKVAKKYYTFLSDQPTVAIIKILPIRRELLSPLELKENVVISPAIIARKRGKKKQSRGEQRSSLFSESNVTNNSTLNDTYSNSMQNDISVSAEVLRKKKLNKRVKENIENYLLTLNGTRDNKEENSPENSPKKEVNLSRYSENVAYDSENEFQGSQSKKNQKSAEKPVKKKVTNPFSKDAQGQTNSKISEKRKSLWRKKFGSGERTVRRRKFYETFVKRGNDSDIETGNEHEGLDDIKQENGKVEIHNNESKSKKIESKRVNSHRKRIIIPIEDDSDTDVDTQTYDSLSVNCQPLFSMPSSNIEKEDRTQQTNSQTSPLMSFGEGGGKKDDEHIEQELNTSIDDDIIDLYVISPKSIELIDEEEPESIKHVNKETFEPMEQINEETRESIGHMNEETIPISKNLANGDEETSDGNLSDDLYDSPTKSASPSDRLVIDLCPRSNIESQINNVGSSPSSSDSSKLKGKPKITSDKKLEKHIHIPAHIKLQRPSIAVSPSSPVIDSNEVHTASTNINSNQPDLNGLIHQTSSNSRTPTSRGLKTNLKQVKCNLNNEESVQEYQNAKSKKNANCVDESFESICQDLTNLSSTEGITLYKGSEDTANDDTPQKENSSSLTVVSDNASETQSATETAAADTPSPASHQSPQFNFTAKTKPKVMGSGDTIIPCSQQKRPLRGTRSLMISNTSLSVDRPLRSFPGIPRKDPRLNKSAGPATLSERDPRLNKSVSPETLAERDPRLNNSPSPPTLLERDPRFNRPIHPNKSLSVPTADMRVTRSAASLQKSPVLSSADPRLTRGQSRPRSATPTPATNISPSIEKGEEVKIVDPRLRKRKEREEAEKAAMLAKEQELSKPSVDVPQPEQSPQVLQLGQSSPSTEKKRTVFQRLGCREPSPVRASVQNEFISIIKSRNTSPTKSICDDDDNISLHPGISDFYDSSDEDNKDSSPRHRKFESERNRTMSANSSETIQTNALQQRLSVKQRIGLRVGDAQVLSNRRAPISALSDSSTLAPPLIRPATTATTPVNTLLNRQARFALGARAQQQARVPNLNVPPPNLNVPPPTVISNTSFMDSYYQMNAKQMMQDEDNMMTNEQTSEVYVTFDNGTADKPSEYDYISILDNKPDTSIKGLSDPKYTFFKNQCYKMLRDGKCKTELFTCHFHHHGKLLLRTAKTKNPEFIKAILDTCIEQNFDYYLDNVWKEILPVIKADAFTVYEKLYKANKRGQHFVLELLNYCLTEGIHTVDSFLRKIAPVIEDNDTDTVQAICVAIKNKLADGFCWETIKVICKKAAPPRDMVELVLLQCLKRKKNRNHILEVHNMIKKKMIALDRNKISNNLLKPFYELVARNNPPDTNKEILSTMPLMNVTNNLINGQSFERQSVNVPKPVVQFTGVPKSTKSATKRAETLTPISPDNTPLRSSPSEIQAQTPITGEITNFAEYTVKTVDAGEPTSIFRDRFWKLYSAVNCVSKGLTHQDYDYVWEQLDKFTHEEVPKEVLKKAYYQILCTEVTSSEHHLNEVIKRAVKESSKKSTCLLFEVGIHALIDLGNSEFWVMALELLNRLKVFEPEMLPTAFILISAEIYLANNDPLEALVLLQRTKLIRTNRDEWLVNDSNKADEKHRNKVVFILLQSLAYVDPDKAVFLFKELMADQYIYYYPIDLSRYLDKFTLVLFVHRRLDLAAEMARLVMDHDMTYQKSTYQELLSRLLSVDEVLVNQILEYAVNLGYYNDMKIRQGFTTLIIDYNYTEEELYLILKRLVHKLALNLGPVIPRLKSSHLKVTLVLEDIPTGKRLYKNETVSKINLNKNKHMRRLISNILATRFSPRIKLSQTRADRFCKIMSRTLVDHLKHWH